jgi:hypothetical protein
VLHQHQNDIININTIIIIAIMEINIITTIITLENIEQEVLNQFEIDNIKLSFLHRK